MPLSPDSNVTSCSPRFQALGGDPCGDVKRTFCALNVFPHILGCGANNQKRKAKNFKACDEGGHGAGARRGRQLIMEQTLMEEGVRAQVSARPHRPFHLPLSEEGGDQPPSQQRVWTSSGANPSLRALRFEPP